MNRTKAASAVSFVLVAFALALPALTELVLSPELPLSKIALIPQHLGQWTGKNVRLLPIIKERYAQKEVRLTVRMYTQPGREPIQTIVQQATNFNNLHDVYACLEMNETSPHRIETERLPGVIPAHATLVECKFGGTPHYALFCYQTKAGTASYPAKGPIERAQLSILGRRPCRLIELVTPIGTNKNASAANLRELAGQICALPM